MGMASKYLKEMALPSIKSWRAMLIIARGEAFSSSFASLPWSSVTPSSSAFSVIAATIRWASGITWKQTLWWWGTWEEPNWILQN